MEWCAKAMSRKLVECLAGLRTNCCLEKLTGKLKASVYSAGYVVVAIVAYKIIESFFKNCVFLRP